MSNDTTQTESPTPILAEAQYQNFFRNLSEIVHSDLPTVEDKKAALMAMINDPDNDNSEDDLNNLAEFVCRFDGEV